MAHDAKRVEPRVLQGRHGSYQMTGVRLGAGAFGQVTQGLDVDSQEPVAIKLFHSIHAAQYQDPRAYNKICAEEEAEKLYYLKQFPIPGVVSLLDGPILVGDDYYLIYPLVTGQSFRRWLQDLKHSRLSSEAQVATSQQIVSLMVQLTQTLEALWRFGLVHRDLKPDNMMVRSLDSNDGTIQPTDRVESIVLDFGNACVDPIQAAGNRTPPPETIVCNPAHLMSTRGYISADFLQTGRANLQFYDRYALGMVFLDLTSAATKPTDQKVFLDESYRYSLIKTGLPECNALIDALLENRPQNRPSFAFIQQKLSQIQRQVREGAVFALTTALPAATPQHYLQTEFSPVSRSNIISDFEAGLQGLSPPKKAKNREPLIEPDFSGLSQPNSEDDSLMKALKM
jgi:serine/threonine protein kinase